jgi:SAM-dependent methyltransferase
MLGSGNGTEAHSRFTGPLSQSFSSQVRIAVAQGFLRIMSSLSVQLAEFLMRHRESERPCWANGAELNEIVRHPRFVQAPESERAALMMRSAQAKYESEIKYSWDHYFGMNLKPLLAGKRVLDLGSLYGGRSVAWAEKYQLANITGIDVNPIYIEAAARFAESKHVNAEFYVACGEKLPFESESFDAILTFDVLEHVQSPRSTLAECHRVYFPHTGSLSSITLVSSPVHRAFSIYSPDTH